VKVGTRSAIALLIVLLLPATCAPAQSKEAPRASTSMSERLRATGEALRWLYSRQNADGGFGDPASDPQTTCQVVLAFAAGYEKPATVEASGESPLDYLKAQAGASTNSAEGTALLILAVVAGDGDPRDSPAPISRLYWTTTTTAHRVATALAALTALALRPWPSWQRPYPGKLLHLRQSRG